MFSSRNIRVRFLRVIAMLVAGFGAPIQAAEQPLADPTQPLNFQASTRAAVSYHLNSVFISEQRTRAIINGQLVGVNDQVGQAKVLEINPSSVVLHTPEGRKTLQLHKTIKRARSGQ